MRGGRERFSQILQQQVPLFVIMNTKVCQGSCCCALMVVACAWIWVWLWGRGCGKGGGGGGRGAALWRSAMECAQSFCS
jgi:hypothetical protein